MGVFEFRKEERHQEINFTGTGFLFLRHYETKADYCPYDIDLHQHEWHEFVWCRAPRGGPQPARFIADGVPFPMSDATLSYSPPYSNHRFHVDHPMTTWVIGIDQEQMARMFAHSPIARPLEGLFSSWRSLPPSLEFAAPGAPDTASSDLDSLAESCQAPGSLESLNAVYFLVALDRIISPWKGKAIAPSSSHGPVDGVARLALEYLEKNFARQIGVADCASRIGVSRSTLSHQFRAATGMSIPQCLSEIRLRHARALLVETDLDILEISLECGFNDAGWFSRQFRAAQGMPPSDWRLRQRDMLNTPYFAHENPGP